MLYGICKVTSFLLCCLGEHPAVGAMDVCPFVPVANVTMDDCVQCSKEFGKTLAEELDVPVYLYEYSSQRSYRKKLPDIREGEYKGLPKKVINYYGFC